MGRALAVAALTLAACVVDVEGAPCLTPENTDECPAGQACGNDLKCSERAAACVAAGTFCVPDLDTRCAANSRERCREGGPCGEWEAVEDCGPLFCDDLANDCRCAPGGTNLYVDASAGGTTPGLAPTGASEPPECRFPSISMALDAASAGDTVHVVDATPAVYSDLPIRVKKDVALVADDSPLDPAARVLENAATTVPGVVLEEGAKLEGFTVRAAPGSDRQLGIKVECAGPDEVTIRKVRVDAPGAMLGAGIALTGSCPVVLEDAEIAGVTGVGLTVSLGSEDAVVTVTRGVLDGNGTGISLTRGDLRLDRTTVRASVGTGLLAGDGGADTRITAVDCLFKGNLDTAIQLNGNLRVDLRQNRVCQNFAVTERGSALRKVGGLFARGAPPPSPDLVFRGNELVGNAADQVFVTGTPTKWILDGGSSFAACASDRNLFRGYSGEERGLVADAPVDARWNGWEGVTPSPPPLGRDYEVLGAGAIDVGASDGSYCDPVPAARACDG